MITENWRDPQERLTSRNSTGWPQGPRVSQSVRQRKAAHRDRLKDLHTARKQRAREHLSRNELLNQRP